MKLFVTDYDNTLYINDDEIKETIKDLKKLKKRDTIIMISTGRALPSIKREITRNNIPFDYVSCADGSIIYDHNFNLVKAYHMNKDIISELDYLKRDLNYEEIQISYLDGYSNLLDLTKTITSLNFVIHIDNYDQNIINKINYLKEKYPEYNYVSYLHDFIYFVCIKKKNVSKAKSISYLSRKLKIKKKDIYVIGDADNDIEMIQEFHGVTLENGTDRIKAASSKIYNKISDYINEI
jgi:HAD superfamily hydrolase (TIGR01484 family)